MEQLQNLFYLALKGPKEERERYLRLKQDEEDEKALPLPAPEITSATKEITNNETDTFDLFKHTHVEIDDEKFTSVKHKSNTERNSVDKTKEAKTLTLQ